MLETIKHQEIDKLAWLHVCDGKVLVARSKGKDLYYLPGGKREPGESDHAALTREIKEELLVDLRQETLAYAATFRCQADGKAEGVQVKLACYSGEYAGELTAHAEIEEVAWITYEAREKCSLAAQLVLDWLWREGKIKGAP